MFISNDFFAAVDDDREDLALDEPAEQPPRLLAHLELVGADRDFAASVEPSDLDPPTPPLPYVTA
jgi:hypothetical protein